MNRNMKIARELLRLAKRLVADNGNNLFEPSPEDKLYNDTKTALKAEIDRIYSVSESIGLHFIPNDLKADLDGASSFVNPSYLGSYNDTDVMKQYVNAFNAITNDELNKIKKMVDLSKQALTLQKNIADSFDFIPESVQNELNNASELANNMSYENIDYYTVQLQNCVNALKAILANKNQY